MRKAPMSVLEVAAAIGQRLFEEQPHEVAFEGPAGAYRRLWTREKHIARVAYLVVHGWRDPITIDVGVPEIASRRIGHWFVPDGNHRVAAAIYRKDATILAMVDGSLREAYNLFGVDCEEHGTTH